MGGEENLKWSFCVCVCVASYALDSTESLISLQTKPYFSLNCLLVGIFSLEVHVLLKPWHFSDPASPLGDVQNLQGCFFFFIFYFFIPADTTRQPRPGEVNGKGELVAVGSVSLDSLNNSGFQSRALILGTLLWTWVLGDLIFQSSR